jgi:hypothetical protein
MGQFIVKNVRELRDAQKAGSSRRFSGILDEAKAASSSRPSGGDSALAGDNRTSSEAKCSGS